MSEKIPTRVGMIVPTLSATLDGFLIQTSSIPENHMDMCQFADKNEIGYQRILGFLLSFVQDIEEKIASGE